MLNPKKFLNKITYNHLFAFLVCVLIIEFMALKDLPFFWDAIMKSDRANWIYNHNLKYFIVPTEINSGHPPLWIYSLAVFWEIFGKTLVSARFLLLLVNIGVAYQILILCKNSFVKTTLVLAALLVFIEPTLIAQTTSLNNDMLLLFFSLMALNALIKNSKPWLLFIALSGLLLTNLRGIYIVLAILIIHLVFVKFNLIKNNKKLFLGYLVALGTFALFCFFQYKTLGWFIISQNENYNAHRQPVGIKLILINTTVYIKSFLEYGRFVIFLFLMPLLFKYLKNKHLKNKKINKILIAISVFAFIFFIGMVPFSNPIGPRYFMICYILSIVLFISLIYHLNKSRLYKITSITTIVLFLVTGHFWVYPATLSQPWDSSLAYLNYFKIEKEMERYINAVPINHQDIGTRIRLNARKHSSLMTLPQESLYSSFNIETNPYILYSNIENYTKNEELLHIKNNWTLVKTFQNKGVYISLYKNPNM
jgi:4-amino-4-deoxy-L-arabinose transferase-like glycosyltransferase